MAIPMTNIPVLTGKVAERFVEQCEYNAKHLAGSQWSQEREDRFNAIIESSTKERLIQENDSIGRSRNAHNRRSKLKSSVV